MIKKATKKQNTRAIGLGQHSLLLTLETRISELHPVLSAYVAKRASERRMVDSLLLVLLILSQVLSRLANAGVDR